MDPEMHPEFAELPPEVKPIVKEMALKSFGTPEENLLKNSLLGGEINPKKMGEIPAEVEGYEVEQLIGPTGEPTLRIKKGFVDKFIIKLKLCLIKVLQEN